MTWSCQNFRTLPTHLHAQFIFSFNDLEKNSHPNLLLYWRVIYIRGIGRRSIQKVVDEINDSKTVDSLNEKNDHKIDRMYLMSEIVIRLGCCVLRLSLSYTDSFVCALPNISHHASYVSCEKNCKAHFGYFWLVCGHFLFRRNYPFKTQFPVIIITPIFLCVLQRIRFACGINLTQKISLIIPWRMQLTFEKLNYFNLI